MNKFKNKLYLIISLVLITSGFICMKLETAEFGLGPLALTVAPILLILGYGIGYLSIFPSVFGKDFWQSQKVMLIAGWSLFFISFAVYLSTVEETASLWDCAEFIACAYKLQVPHPPGAPLFLLVGRLFSFFSFGNVKEVAYWVNMVSVFTSAATVMLTFWTIVMLGRRIRSNASNFTLVISGAVGSLCIAFADSFWFSAVEAETYAFATFFLILNFWAILKWSQVKSTGSQEAWILFIFYSMGLSIGVHPMSLLVLPAITVLMVFKYRKVSWQNLAIGSIAGASMILFLNQIVLFGLPDVLKYADILFVNGFRWPFYSGVIFTFCALLGIGYYIHRLGERRNKRWISLSAVGILYFLIGYSTYFMVIIRSQSDTPIDEQNPDNMISLSSYLKRESYGSRPLLFGPNFTSKVVSYKKGNAVYVKTAGHYEISDYGFDYEYNKDEKTLLPRMYSTQPDHITTYKQWTGLKDGQNPSIADNIEFMIRYQLGHMYFRYLMFNFSGRESDVQHADWQSPLDIYIDNSAAIGENAAHNNFLMLPLLLGILGIFFQYRLDRKGFWSVMLFFLFLSLILVFYLNATPNEPRERDYIYVGSFLAFALWCGLGAMGIMEFLQKGNGKYAILGVLLFLVPALMGYEGFDDHNRSGRTIQVDHARNTLAACAPDAILFTGGDNDTFPLWYVQEVEGFRTDVRVIVLSYFNGDWYIDQMRRKVYDSPALPFSLNQKNYRQGGLNDILPYVENSNITGAISLGKFMELVKEENKNIQVEMAMGTKYNSIPSRTFFMNVDKEKVGRAGIVPPKFQKYIPDKMEISWKGNFMEKSALMVLDLIAASNWERPIYFNITSLNGISLRHVYRLLPITVDEEAIDTDKMYVNLMEKSEFHDLANEKVYYNHEDYELRILQATRSVYNELAADLLKNEQPDKAKKVIDFSWENLYGKNKKPDLSSVRLADLLLKTGNRENGEKLALEVYDRVNDTLAVNNSKDECQDNECRLQLYTLRQLYDVCQQNNLHDLAEKCAEKFKQFYMELSAR